VDEVPAEQVGARFGYSPATVHQLAAELRAGRTDFFRSSKPGPKGPRKTTTIRDRVLVLRAADRSVTEIADALTAAGGATEEADLVALNKAAPVRDGQRIYVPRPGETVPAGSAGSEAQLKIDVNHATAAELEALPGIGPTIAARIVRSRGGHPFTRIEELQTRGLVTARIFADIKDMVTTR
jgi:DNA uptake protein ComE-like DNA-binding protein